MLRQVCLRVCVCVSFVCMCVSMSFVCMCVCVPFVCMCVCVYVSDCLLCVCVCVSACLLCIIVCMSFMKCARHTANKVFSTRAAPDFHECMRENV